MALNEQNTFLTDNMPGVFTNDEYELIITKISETITYIAKLDSPRLLIIETWLIIDWFIRQILATGINITHLSTENFDVKYSILPNSSKGCIVALEKFINVQKKLETPPPPKKYLMRFSIETLCYLKKKHPKLLKKLNEITKELGKEQAEPSSIKWSSADTLYSYVIDKKNITYRSVSEDWLKSVSKLDSTWFKHANKLNDVRNLAAHAFDTDKIFLALGLSKNRKKIANKDKIIKNFCLEMLEKLVGIKI